MGFEFVDCRLKNDKEIACQAIQLDHPENVFSFIDNDCFNLRNRMV